jgi:Zinc dependent phospholipase C
MIQRIQLFQMNILPEYRNGYNNTTHPFSLEVSCQTGNTPSQLILTLRGYGCSGADDLSEISIPVKSDSNVVHWPPFLKAAVEHIRDTYPNPETNEKAQSLIAFIFAVSGHQVQDAAWHSIGLLMGFIDEVAKVDCKGSFGAAHETLDWGGDSILAKRYSGKKGSLDWAFVFLLVGSR